MFKSQMTHHNSKKQADTAKEIMERLPQFKSKIFYLSLKKIIFNLLNVEQQLRSRAYKEGVFANISIKTHTQIFLNM